MSKNELGQTKTKKYCRRRGRNDTNCKTMTYNKHKICSGCQCDIEMLAEDIKFIKELNIKI